MFRTKVWGVLALLVVFSMILGACTSAPTAAPVPATKAPSAPAAPQAAQEFIFGVVLVGPYNDHGWSEAHYQAGKYVEAKVPGAKMIYVDNLNPGAKPGVTVPQVVDDLISKGAKLILTTSDDFKDGTLEAATKNPKVPIINVSGDHAWKQGKDFKAPANLSNFMGRMEYGKMMAGCAAALTSQTGKIGYLGPLINDETRRLAASAYLGAKYCWTTYAKKNAADLKFKVTWIGFWFNIPGQTLDPTKVADDFYNSGYDVVLSGIDTTEALVEAGKMSKGRQEGVGRAVRLQGWLQGSSRCLPGRALLQLGAVLRQGHQAGAGRQIRQLLRMDWPGLEGHQQR